MPFLVITPKAVELKSHNDFGVEVSGTELLVPQNVARALNQLSVRTAEDFVSYLNTFPSAVASALGWNIEDVMHAKSSLFSKLHGLVAEEILNPSLRPRRVYGAHFPPAFNNNQNGISGAMGAKRILKK